MIQVKVFSSSEILQDVLPLLASLSIFTIENFSFNPQKWCRIKQKCKQTYYGECKVAYNCIELMNTVVTTVK